MKIRYNKIRMKHVNVVNKSNVSTVYDVIFMNSLGFLLASLDTVIASLSGAVEAAAERDGKGVRPPG